MRLSSSTEPRVVATLSKMGATGILPGKARKRVVNSDSRRPETRNTNNPTTDSYTLSLLTKSNYGKLLRRIELPDGRETC
jgi:hypothetical protein